jgi:hypothetical protein
MFPPQRMPESRSEALGAFYARPVMELMRPAAEGWHEDPYGRHKERFFDGHKWTPYVRNGDANGIDEPGGPVVDEVTKARNSLLSEDVLVVERFTDLRRRWSDRTVQRRDGSRAGMLRRAAPVTARPESGVRSMVIRDHTQYDIVELVDDKGTVLLTLNRPIDVQKSSVEVLDSEGHDAGRIVQQNLRSGETTYAFLGPGGGFVGELQAENWVGWDLRIYDNNQREVATITRDWAGLDLSSFPRPDDYVVRLWQPLHEPLRTLVVACALSLEIVVRPDEQMS